MPRIITPLVVRLLRHTKKTSKCWLWKGATKGNGYGMIGVLRIRRPISTHRAAYELFVGPIPPGLCVLHKCDVRNCVNPDHLFLGTQRDNIHDSIRKGRFSFVKAPRGERNGRAKLTVSDVRAIRDAHDRRGISCCQLSRLYNMSSVAIDDVVHRRHWSHVK